MHVPTRRTGRECETRTQANAGDNNAATIVTAVLLAVVVAVQDTGTTRTQDLAGKQHGC